MTSKEYREFEEALIAPILGISRDTEERDAANWDSFSQLANKYGS